MRCPLIITSLLALAAAGCGASAQHARSTQLAGVQCAQLTDLDRQVANVYAPEKLSRVEPMYRTELITRAVQPRYVSGARLYVPAEQGMTEGYLTRVLTCHAASQAATHPNDPLRVANVRSIAVKPQGQRLVISIEGADRKAGKEIWQRASALRDPSSRIEVKQLSRLGAEAGAL